MALDTSRWGLCADGQNNLVGPAIASAATIAPTHMIHSLTGTTPVTTITPPAPGFAGILILIPATATANMINTGGNIQTAVTSAIGVIILLVYNPVTGKWYPLTGISSA